MRTLVYDFESEEERLAWEQRLKKRWENRLSGESIPIFIYMNR